MSAELVDFRVRITQETAAALEAVARAFKRDKADVAREVLHNWALRKHMEARVLMNLSASEGFSRALDGNQGIDT